MPLVVLVRVEAGDAETGEKKESLAGVGTDTWPGTVIIGNRGGGTRARPPREPVLSFVAERPRKLLLEELRGSVPGMAIDGVVP